MPRRSNQEAIANPDDIRHGFGTVKAVHTEKGLHWVLPGNALTMCKNEAQAAAEKLDRMIQSNVKRTGRSLIW
jgi:hypothetical protein